jgi:polyisoprenoid-binding protein YceI
VREDGGSGRFVVDMTSISVTATPKKPGKEGALEGHLKGDRWFDTAKHPTATVVIDSVSAGEAPGEYRLAGTLTLKEVTKPVAFPAKIVADASGALTTEATLTIDRTLWGITSSSGSFFDDLGDNAVDDMINLEIRAVARAS